MECYVRIPERMLASPNDDGGSGGIWSCGMKSRVIQIKKMNLNFLFFARYFLIVYLIKVYIV